MKYSVTPLLTTYTFLLLFTLILFPDAALAQETPVSNLLISKLKSCEASLTRSPSKKNRARLRSCIHLAKNIYYHEVRTESVRLESVSILIDIYEQFGEFSGDPSSRDKADYWKKIQTERLSRNPEPSNQKTNVIVNLRNSIQGKRLRVVLDLREQSIYKTAEDRNAHLVEIEFENTGIDPAFLKRAFTFNHLEMKAELKTQDQTTKLTFSQANYNQFHISQLPDPNRWIIDFQLPDTQKKADAAPNQIPAPPLPRKTVEEYSSRSQGIHKIMIDPGHGGKDPGAIGPGGYTEKEAVLDIGLRLKELLLKQLKVEVMMTRSNDVFIPLGERTKMANEANADLFISIHANSSPHRTTRGVEIYLLGKSSDKRALRTAARENNVSEEEASQLDQNLASIKKDLFQEYKKEESLELAHATRSSLMNRLRPAYPVLDLGVKTAPFYVLINTSMPSILAEVSFISNPAEEQRLKNRSYRQIMAESLLEGITKFIAANSNPSIF